MSDPAPWKEISVEEGGVRLDAWLSKKLHQLSRRSAQAFLAQGNVRINGRSAAKGHVLKAGDIVSILAEPAPRNWRPVPNDQLPLDVLIEDDAYLVVNKISGMPSTANSPDDRETLANAIVARYPECAGIGVRNGDAGLLHRLDNDTSGLLIVARSVRAYKSLKTMQESNQIEKRYLALVSGASQLRVPQTISVPLDSLKKGGRKMGVVRGGQRAVTHLEEMSMYGDLGLVKVLIYKGVRHQIRVHLAHQGTPICGDELYSGPAAPLLNRLFLHASGLTFFHPVTSEPVVVDCPLPDDLQKVMKSLN